MLLEDRVPKVVVLRGISGSGKSTYAKNLAAEVEDSVIVSADNYFYKDGEYKFDKNKLGDAHAECLRQFLFALERGTELVIVDNTSAQAFECSPYMQLSYAFEYDAEIVTLVQDPSVAAKRNLHGVNETVIRRQLSNIENARMPSYWKRKEYRTA